MRLKRFEAIGAIAAPGTILAGAPFGGLHNNPPVVAVFGIACIINALLFGGILFFTHWGYRFVGTDPAAKSER